uniref:HGWP repeat containing protein-like n=1 Tax=Oryza sativa subsp. japonica TaxID=39947 RepID=Q6K5L8_ORYSJ|nr:HGWP repeat containing protein-like [Oryza sativa Japonica Group]BAD22107.1 HGWP repeat containing protein-like [Oryza sativa Japonica Group]
MEPRSPRRFPSSPAALSHSHPYLSTPRASLLRFRPLPLSLPVGIELAPSSSLSAVAAKLRSAAVVAPDLLPLRHRLLRLRRVLADLVHSSVSPADRRSTAVLVDPSRAAASLRFGRRSHHRRRPGVSRGPPFRFPLPSPLSGAAPSRPRSPPATIGARARRLPSAVPARPPSGAPRGCHVGPGRQPPAPSGAADAWDPRRRPAQAACTRSTVDREAAAWAPLPWTRLAQFFPNPEEEFLEDEGFGV